MPRRRAHVCLTADDTGLLKRVDVEKAATTQIWGVQAAGGGVERACWAPGGAAGVGLQDGTVRFWDAAGSGAAPLCEFTAHASAGLGTAGLGVCGADGASSARVVACDRAGCVRVWPWRPGGGDGDGDDDGANESGAAEPAHSFQAGGAAAVARLAPPGDGEPQLATGGRGVDLAVWSVATGQPAWRARNVPHDELELVVPV